jgi:putative ABC transport system ATP-binding protein
MGVRQITDKHSASSAEPIVVARGLRRTYVRPDHSDVHALDGVDLEVHRGQVTVIAGPSGSGKSTLLQVLAGLDRPDEGSVTIGRESITGGGDEKLARFRRRHIGFVFQSFNLIDSLSARDNIALPIQIDGRKVDEPRLESLAASLGMVDRLDHFPHQLSGGQQQRIAVIRALLADPDVVFADEPTAALDPASVELMISMLEAVAHEHGHAVVAISHDPAVAARGDKVYQMTEGKLTLVADRVVPTTVASASPTREFIEPAQISGATTAP